MPAKKRIPEAEKVKPRHRKPATTPEDRENQLVSAAINLAEKQLDEGTASSQVITHYLKLGSTRERLEQERLRGEVELMKAKIKDLESREKSEEMYKKALIAMGIYSGQTMNEDEDVMTDAA